MTYDEFKEKALSFVPELPQAMGYIRTRRLQYLTMGLSGESGEFAEKVKKLFRDADGIMTEQRRQEMILELGDVLWNLTCLAAELNTSLPEIAEKVIEKYESRRRRGTLHGSGDDR